MWPSLANPVVVLSFPLYAVVDFPSMDRHTPWSCDAQLDLSSSNVDHLDLDVITDHDGLLRGA